jgi:DNA-binding NtrC family response regulator
MKRDQHLILVIDDQIGKPDSPDRTAFLRAVGYFSMDDSEDQVSDYPYEFEFHTGQSEGGDNSVEAVKAVIQGRWPDANGKRWALVLLDVRFGDDERFGFTLLRALREDSKFGKDLPIVMLTSEDEGKRALAGELNANGFLPKHDAENKPFWSRSELDLRVLKYGLIPDDRNDSLLAATHTSRLLGSSLPLLKVLRAARFYALDPRGGRILYGETGSGKTELAGYIHCHAHRSGPYIHWFADPASKDVAKGELFGWWKGAFTGADHPQAGKIEKAHGGTFFLDEVANLPRDVQMAILQIRDPDEGGRRRFARLGNFPSDQKEQQAARKSVAIADGVELLADHKVRADVLLLTGTNRNLEDSGVRKEKEFLDDLLSDLGTPLQFPNLNDRRDDVVELFKIFAQRILGRSRGLNQELPMDEAVLDLLRNRDWSRRGNVRDLKRIAEYAAQQLGDFDVIRLHSLPADVLQDANAKSIALPPAATAAGADKEQESFGADDGGSRKPGALTQAELAHLRRRAELLEEAAEATRKVDAATGVKGEYRPTAAVERLMGNKLPKKGATTNAVRIIKDILGTILNTPDYLEHAYGKENLESLREWVKSRPVLMSLFRYSIKEISADKIHEHL